MNCLLVLLLLFLWKLTVAMDVELALNPKAPLTREVQSIQHFSQTREVHIELKLSRRCHKPTFRVRLSGTSLYILDFAKSEANLQVYSYPLMVDAGAYFLEVMALLCATFDPSNFADMCLEDPSGGTNVVTLPYSFQVSPSEVSLQSRPRWTLSDKSKAAFLSTRYQKLGCNTEANYYCQDKQSDLWQYSLYEWKDNVKYTRALSEVMEMSRNETDVVSPAKNTTINVCMIGDSHAREIALHSTKVDISSVKFIHVESRFPHDFNVTWVESYHCSYTVVTYGQWPASVYTNRHPYTQTKYHEELRRVIILLQGYNPSQSQVFMLSVNYNALGARQTACPPVDYRSPPVIDMYNTVLKELIAELNVEYIDLNHIMGPMWDSALDWNHPVGPVATAEAKWVITHLLQYSLRRQLPVVLHDAALGFPENILIRFTDSTEVYLYQKGVMRAFPNGRVFVLMGFDFGDVKVKDASMRADVKFGPVLPS